MPSAPGSPRSFFGDPNPPPQAPEPPKVSSAPAGPGTSAGTGALPPETQAQPNDGPEPGKGAADRFTVVEGADGVRRGFSWDKDGPTAAGEVKNTDADAILHAVGQYNEATKTWDNVPPSTFKALLEGRPAPPAYWKQQYDAGEAQAVMAQNALLFLDGKKTSLEVAALNHAPTIQAQLADRPDMAWLGKGGIAVDFLKHPVTAAIHSGEKVAGELAGFVRPVLDVAKESLVGAGLGAAAAAPFAAHVAAASAEAPPVAGVVAAATVAGGASAGATAGAFHALYRMEAGNLAADWLAKGIPDETIKTYAPIGGAVKAGLWMTSFKYLPLPGKQAVLAGLAKSPLAQKAMANLAVRIAGESASAGALMAAQSKIGSLLNNMAAEAAKRPDLLEDPKEADLRALEAGLVGLTGVAVVSAATAGAGAAARALPKREGAPKAAEAPAPARGPGIGLSAALPSSAQEVETGTAERTYLTPATNTYVVDRPLDLAVKGDSKSTAKDFRGRVVGNRNEQIARGNQLAEEMKGAVPDKGTQLAMRWYAEAQGDEAVLKEWLKAAEEARENNAGFDAEQLMLAELSGERPSTLGDHIEEIRAALKLSPEAKAQVEKGDVYFRESGEVAQKNGAIRELRENYALNHLYMPEKVDDVVRTEQGSTLQPATGHAKARVYNTLFDAAEAGKRVAPVGYADLIAAHNVEMARAVEARKLLNAMDQIGVGGWKSERPEGWKQVGDLEKAVPVKNEAGDAVIGQDGNQVVSHLRYYAPEGLAKGLASITQPNFTSWLDEWRKVQRYQGLVKTVDLSYSLFHHASLLAATLNEGDYGTLLDLPKAKERMQTEEFRAQEQWAAQHHVMTEAVSPNYDAMKGLTEDAGDLQSKISEAPVAKQALEVAEANRRLLFSTWARFMKVNDFTRLAAEWAANNPAATNEETRAALLEVGRHVNATFGGLNWEAMGVTKTQSAILRTFMLAPDWFVSNATFMKEALAEKGVGGVLAKKNLVRAAVYGGLALEALNVALAGKPSWKNEKGHTFEVEVAPHVYFSPFRGGPGELLKIWSMIRQSGRETAPGQYAQAKGSPITRVGAGLLSGTKYSGAPIVPKKDKNTLKGDLDMAKFLVGTAGPIPFGVSSMWEYQHSHEATVAGTLWVASGLGRYAPPHSRNR